MLQTQVILNSKLLAMADGIYYLFMPYTLLAKNEN